ncbi:inorganic phosphate transporter [Laspinema olomoucense]|uniref:Phosphate transporter n=1 Tax=Laspinema olomoucense D3b TaxID=2953688 RepID=A0ABT2NFY3_9CYAN|nr:MULTISPECIES: inorganic phosphate transporter [unclassified Laspinema]MCT7973908.1 inorganic phosphate transporter [Laspinema sp. D3d]MCT7981406.1 inorganic phosphate transporter [Laspinema sp. D3b]MCT7989717.1 inorganic phosphate transporter [Laspinema sp. D3a]
MTVLLALLAFYVAANLGANDVANSMGTSVGSKAVTLRQALMIAGVLEFTGAVFFGQEVSQTLATSVLEPSVFAHAPHLLLTGMICVMVSCGIWLQVATSQGWPVASSHAIIGAIAGFSIVAVGLDAVDWSTIRLISISWLLTPAISALIAATVYSFIKRWILEHPEPLQQLDQWIPWLSSLLLGVFGIIVLPKVLHPLNVWIGTKFGILLPPQDLPLLVGGIAAVGLTLVEWRHLEQRNRENGQQLEKDLEQESDLQTDSEIKSTVYSSPIEKQLARFQVLSACFVAFAHGSNDVGNAVAPLAAIAYIRRTGSVPLDDFSVPLWILILGGAGIVTGLGIWGKKVILTVGENIIALKPSGGFCAELATATTVLIASRFGLPVSTSHSLVGGVIGIGLIQNPKSIRLETLRGIFLAWIITVPIAALLAAGLFSIVRLIGE